MDLASPAVSGTSVYANGLNNLNDPDHPQCVNIVSGRKRARYIQQNEERLTRLVTSYVENCFLNRYV